MGIWGFLCGEESFLPAALQPKAAQPGGVSFGGERRALSCPSLSPGDGHLARKIVPTEDKSLFIIFFKLSCCRRQSPGDVCGMWML